jgi:adenine/guanine phosphoribosyltransferase-like PRPP-binding protein
MNILLKGLTEVQAQVLTEYFKEYQGANASGGDELCMPKATIKPGARVLIIDDLVATGGTLIAACDLMSSAGFSVLIYEQIFFTSI